MNFEEKKTGDTGITAQGTLFQIPKKHFDTDHINIYKVYFYADMRTSKPAEQHLQGFYINYSLRGVGDSLNEGCDWFSK